MTYPPISCRRCPMPRRLWSQPGALVGAAAPRRVLCRLCGPTQWGVGALDPILGLAAGRLLPLVPAAPDLGQAVRRYGGGRV